MNLPERFTEKMKGLLGDEYEAFIKSYEEGRNFGLRVNTSKISPEEFQKIAPFHLKRIPWVKNGFYYEAEDRPARHPFYYAGLYYLQEPSAMSPASRLEIESGDKVLDLCAAPGGKATELGAKLRGEGLLVANDISASRARALLKNVEIFGIPNAFLINEVPAKIADQFEEFFDKILLDAPCSGEGMFRKDPDVAKVWSQEKSLECSRIQKDLILSAAKMLSPGGMLLYSTCTFSPEENEEVIQYLLDSRDDFSLIPMEEYEGFSSGRPEWTKNGSEELKKCVRIWPHKMNGEGHFMALLKKEGVAGKRSIPNRKGMVVTKADKKILDEFFKNVRKPLDLETVEIRKDQVYQVTKLLGDRKGINFLRNGLYLGEMKKGRFEPSQSLSMALKKEEYDSVVDLHFDDPRTEKYLKGETIEIDDIETSRKNGWQLVCVDGYPMGWGKLVNGTLKNKYHAGWRMK